MRSSRRRPLLVPVLLCALAVFVAHSTGTGGDAGEAAGIQGSGVGAEVARLYRADVAVARQYAAGRREAEELLAGVRRAGLLLDRERRVGAALRQDRDRTGRPRDAGAPRAVARLAGAPRPGRQEDGRPGPSGAERVVDDAIVRSRRAEARLAADQVKATARWQSAQRRNRVLAEVRKNIGAKLDEARERLQAQAAASVAAGRCGGPVRLGSPPETVTSAWVAPVAEYRLSASFGSSGERWAHRHTGQDFAVPIGTPVRAVGAGRVVKVACGGAFGIQVVIRHDGGYRTQYAHLAAVAIDPGDRVTTGQWIGQSGTTGNSTGPHLHFEVRAGAESDSALDPLPWLEGRGVPVGRSG
ncbi:peptidoglycan DD-metalloendopeptidase family protein [Streptomyces adustus]|uniref:Peptidoglycan DD-metalloendopeptidase family protein n=1 Tax=Streptomyces adustus TaxID=1609272 RepID=A0A5N8VBI0_9ACTN|nr:M23 family metallopeptidase [Streptomyces adustus]MPY32002.1 peptidoglycan DD-metalloendopeptidase family protein [Streptomyces adustus]